MTGSLTAPLKQNSSGLGQVEAFRYVISCARSSYLRNSCFSVKALNVGFWVADFAGSTSVWGPRPLLADPIALP